MSRNDPNAATAPSVESTDQNERIQARRNRIAARAQAQSGVAADDLVSKGEPSVLDREAHKSMAHVASSRTYLDAVVEQGSDKVSLVRVTADMAESNRGRELDERRIARQKRLEEDVDESRKEFDQITSNWEQSLGASGTTDLRAALESQRKLTEALLENKQELIEEFRGTLKSKDDEFIKELRSQAMDVQTMLDVISAEEKHVHTEYRSQYNSIEDVFRDERRELVTAASDQWQSEMKHRKGLEEQQHDKKFETVDDFEATLETLRQKDAEQFNKVKLKLETDIQNLEQELQRMRATYQLNSEKLEYNLQVLRKRDDENGATKIQQKRKMLRLQDTLNLFRARIKKQEKGFQDENAMLTEDYKRITDQFKDLQKKFKHFQTLERERYDEVWEMAEEENVELANRVLAADKAIVEQQLGLLWHGPDESMLMSQPPTDTTEREATEALREIMDEQPQGDVMPNPAVKNALELICAEAGFLVESKLDGLLKPLAANERSLMRLDSIFKALGVETEADIHRLVGYFFKGEADEEPALISPDEVAAALRTFVEDFRHLRGLDAEPADPDLGKDRRNRNFWGQLVDLHPKEHVDVWNVLGEALANYGDMLKDRSNALDDCDALRAQNAELKTLLHQYMSADINRDLQIPPTVVMAHQVRNNLAGN